jgi:hypothetical protein
MAPLWLLCALSVNFLPVKILATIVLSLFTLLACGMFLLSSVCAFSGGLNSVDRFSSRERATFAICAFMSLGLAVTAVWAIGKINRK